MKRIAIIGGGISGLSVANLLRDRADVVVFERESVPGGLIRCERVGGSLFHICGGHVFNTKNEAVREWFWKMVGGEGGFLKADRNSAVCMEDGAFVKYPIENHVYQFPSAVQSRFVQDLLKMTREPQSAPKSFGDFLLKRFGKTLYDLYFCPYNAKVWRRDLSEVPLEWLAGKLPMPTVEEMLLANMSHADEHQFVHSSFYYPRTGGSQFIADAFARAVCVRTGCDVSSIESLPNGQNKVNGEIFDEVVFCGNLKDLPDILKGVELAGYANEIERLEYHGTTAVFCETDPIPYSWFYQPSPQHDSHRFICTGNFSPTNNAPGKMTCTVEFTDAISRDEIERQLSRMPYHPRYVTHHFSPYTYPIQHKGTREMIVMLKEQLRKRRIHLVGRFAEWEYFNMDAAIASAMQAAQDVDI